MDPLTPLLNNFSLHAGVFYVGNICGIHGFNDDAVRGHLQIIKRGPVQVIGARTETFDITQPTILFLPRPSAHRLIADDRAGADVVCGTVQFGGGTRNPIMDSFPSVVLVELAALPRTQALLDFMYDEAFSDASGRQAALDRLCEVLMIRLIRFCIERRLMQGGSLAGLSDSRLSKAMLAMQEQPAREWTLTDMAALAGMSRARFAVRFREVTGETPADYLASWRIMTAQRLLKRGRPLKHVAFDVGYASAGALARAFVRKLGCSPTQWLKGRQDTNPLVKLETPGYPNETAGELLQANAE